jgi:probable addiction module antidote protein
MSAKIAKRSGRSRASRRAIAERINAALKTGDIAEICRAIEIGTRRHNVADLARRAGINRVSIYRAFSKRGKASKFSTVTMRQNVQPR